MAEIIDFTERLSNTEPHGGRFYSSEHYAEVKQFTPRIAMCSICGSPNHRASSCKLRQRDRLNTD